MSARTLCSTGCGRHGVGLTSRIGKLFCEKKKSQLLAYLF